MDATVTVIIPTQGKRPHGLKRAVASVEAQSEVKAIPLVVVNGPCWGRLSPHDIPALTNLRLVGTSVSGVSRARFLGRQLVDSPYFAFLDDDDELMPDALAIRLDVMEQHEADVVVTNGYQQHGETYQIANDRFDSYPEQPQRALLDGHWLDPAGGLYRSATVTDEIFSALPNILEWTLFGNLLVRSHSIVRHNVPTYIRHCDAADRVTLSREYRRNVPEMLVRLESQLCHRELIPIVRQKLAAAYHQCARTALDEHDLYHAWNFHLRSLTKRDGYRFLSFTRHLFRRQASAR